MLNSFRKVLVTGVALGLSAAVLAPAGAQAASSADKCQAKIEAETNKFGAALQKALTACADAVRKEEVKNVNKPGSGALAKAAKACEGKLQGVYDVDSTKGKSAATKFRAAIAKLADPAKPTCTAADLVKFGHLVSPADGPPSNDTTGVAAMTDSLLVATEATIINNEVGQVGDFLGLVDSAKTAPDSKAGAGDATDCGKGACSLTTTIACSADADCPSGETCTGAHTANRPNLCDFGIECTAHACTLVPNNATSDLLPTYGICSGDTSQQCSRLPGDFPVCTALGKGSCFSPYAGPPYNIAAGQPLNSISLLRAGAIVSGFPAPLPLSGTNIMNVCKLTHDGQGFGAPSGVMYLNGGPAHALNVNTAKLGAAVTAICVNSGRVEGFCDCGGTNAHVNINSVMCQDRVATGQVLDDCGASGADATDDLNYKGTKVGALKATTTSPASADGDCFALSTTQFIIHTSTKTYGADHVPCTADDTATATAPNSIPLTTQTATATVKNANLGEGSCTGSGLGCLENVNCEICNSSFAGKCEDNATVCTTDADCTGKSACTGVPGLPLLFNLASGTLTGAKTSCTNYEASNMSGLKLVGAFVSAGGTTSTGDTVSTSQFVCQ